MKLFEARKAILDKLRRPSTTTQPEWAEAVRKYTRARTKFRALRGWGPKATPFYYK